MQTNLGCAVMNTVCSRPYFFWEWTFTHRTCAMFQLSPHAALGSQTRHWMMHVAQRFTVYARLVFGLQQLITVI